MALYSAKRHVRGRGSWPVNCTYSPSFVSVAVAQLTPTVTATTGGDIVYANSPSLIDVQAAIANAEAGDTVRVPAGSADWYAGLDMSKPISVIGSGVGQTIIRMMASGGLGLNENPGQFCLRYNPSDYSDLTNGFRFSGFTFNLNHQCPWLVLGISNKSEPYTVPYKVRIDHNRVYDPLHSPSISGQMIVNTCAFYGVVDNNQFEGTWYPFKNDTFGTESIKWANEPNNICELGTNNYLYFEDNDIALVNTEGGGDNLCFEGQYSARYVSRYNNITGANSYSLHELHGHYGTGNNQGSCHGAEVYGNNITCTGGQNLFKTRGGRSMVFYNNMNSGSPYCNAYYDLGGVYNNAYNCASILPCRQRVNNTYCWGNKQSYSTAATSVTTDFTDGFTCCGETDNPKLGRDIMGEATTPASVSMGPLASRPATPVLHQAYWATDQSTSSIAGMVGKNPATPISGTLYICESAGVWTDYFDPYTYPHPLRSDPAIGD